VQEQPKIDISNEISRGHTQSIFGAENTSVQSASRQVLGKRATRGRACGRFVSAGLQLQDITNVFCNAHNSEAITKTVDETTADKVIVAAEKVVAVHNVIAVEEVRADKVSTFDKMTTSDTVESATTLQTNTVGNAMSMTSLPAVASLQQDQTFLQAQFRPLDRAVPSTVGVVTFEQGKAKVESDSRSIDDVKYVSEYCDDIFAFVLREEMRGCVDADYMSRQPHINRKMRTILVDWVVEVNKKYDFKSETLFLSVNLIDRYMSLATVSRCNLQLVGVTAMLIASKFEEVRLPEVNEFVRITDNAYTQAEVLEMECTMLATIKYKIAVPTVAHVFPHLERANNCHDAQSKFVMYLLELALLETRCLNHLPSHLISAALLLSNELFGRSQPWPEAMVKKSQYEEIVLRPCVQELRGLLEAAPKLAFRNVQRKYASRRYHAVSTMFFNAQKA